MMAQTMVKKNQSLDSLYASLGLQFLPPAGLINFSLNSEDQDWLQTTVSKLEQQLAELQDNGAGLDLC